MITAMVQFRLPEALNRDRAQEAFSATAPRYRTVAGLVRKYYLLSEDGLTAGGIYLWRSREEGERFFNQEWREFIASRYGCQPEVTWFETPVIVDNLSNEISTDA